MNTPLIATRTGFAANSSSTHSIIFDSTIEYADEDSSFGWEHFTVGDPETKRRYMAAMWKNDYDLSTLNEITGANITQEDLDGWDLYVDHQSVATPPANPELAKDFCNWFANSNAVVLGGNDNEDYGHHLDNGNSIEISELFPDIRYVSKRNGNVWSAFDPQTGNRRRYNYGTEAPIAAWPELVDVKITNYCATGCTYCYQGSTVTGAVASIEDIEEVVNLCKQMNVFEAAIGGGEPLTHPEILTALHMFRAADIVPNITTRDLSWINNKDFDNKVFYDLVGTVAFSVDKAVSLQNILTALPEPFKTTKLNYKKKEYVSYSKISVQIVENTVSETDFRQICTLCSTHHIPLVVLGFKTTGFGASFKHTHDYDWIQVVQDMFQKEELFPWSFMLGTDTVVVQREKDRLTNLTDTRNLTDKEGAWSMYMDAVTGIASPSSFEPNNSRDFVYRSNGATNILNYFKTW